MEPEEFFPDPFVEGGWFVFRWTDRLFQWQTVKITTESIQPASRHATRLKALLWIEKEIQEHLAKEGDIVHETDIYPGKIIIPPNQRTLVRLTYDWEPLNAALEKVR